MNKKKSNSKLYLVFGIGIYVIVCLLGCHVGNAISANPEANLIENLLAGLVSFTEQPLNILPITLDTFKAIGLVTVAFGLAVLWLKIDSQKNANMMPGKESGSAGWNTDMKRYNKTFTDPKNSPEHNGPYNMVLTEDVYLNLNTHQTRRNNNVVVVGGSGSGKSRFFVKPNILQANTNYVITDPAGDLLESTGEFLKGQGYTIKVFNLVEMAKSDCYNPFNYIRDDLGVLMMINCLIKNTTPGGRSAPDPFWEKSETALLQALCFYLVKYRPKEEQNFTSVMKLLRAAEINENNPSAKSKLDLIFDEVARNDPNSIALKQYQTFKMGAGKTLKSILISCSVRLTVFNLKQIENLTGRDTIDLASMGQGKQALFVIIPAADSTYNFLVSMMYSQLFETLYFVAETKTENKRLESHVRFLLDEFANIGQIPEFTQKLSTMRKYEISCSVILQNLAQLKTMYKDDWETIIGNCDSFLFLGGQEYSTLEYISKELGDQTIVVRDNSRSRGKSSSSSMSYKKTGRKLMFPDEIGRLDEKMCILLIRGLRPFLGKKFDYTKHPNYKYTGDANRALKFINTKNNHIEEPRERLDMSYEQKKAAAYTRAEMNTRPEAKIISGAAPMVNVAKALNISKAEQVFARFAVVPPEEEIYDTEATVASETTAPAAKDAGVQMSSHEQSEPAPESAPEFENQPTEDTPVPEEPAEETPAPAESLDEKLTAIKTQPNEGCDKATETPEFKTPSVSILKEADGDGIEEWYYGAVQG